MHKIIKLINQNLDVLPIIILSAILFYFIYLFFKRQEKREGQQPYLKENEKLCDNCNGRGCMLCDYFGTVNK